MNPTATAERAPNPLARIAALLPANAWGLIAAVATLAAIAFGFLYASEQDVLFPGRHFPRTWVLVSVMAATAAAGLLPLAGMRFPPAISAALSSFAAGMMIFGGANLANRGTGLVVLAAGVAAWLAASAASHRRAEPAGALVLGLAAAAATTFAVIAVCVVFIDGDA
jgi:hypothetical protein